MPYTDEREELALAQLANDIEQAGRMTPDEERQLARLLDQVHGDPSNLIGPRWAGTRRDIAQLFAEPGHRVRSAGVTAVIAKVHGYLQMSNSPHCQAKRNAIVRYWVKRTLTPEPIDG